MKCIISNMNVKRFGRAFHALGKLGDVVYVDINNDCFLLHTVNSSRSAYGCFKFLPSFFSSYSFSSQANCKVAIKSCYMVFKSLVTIDKNTERCCFEFIGDSDSLCIKLYCKHDVIKKYTLPFIECEALKTNFEKSQNKNILTAQSRLLSGCISNFQSSVDEVTLIITPDKISLKNYTDEEKDPTKVVHTEVAFELEEFDHHEFEENAELTFCLKEFKAILSYVEGTNAPLTIRFNVAGQPVVFSVENYFEIEIDFVLATLADELSGENGTATAVATKSKGKTSQPSKKRNLPEASQSSRPSTGTNVSLSEPQSIPAKLKPVTAGPVNTNLLSKRQNSGTVSEVERYRSSQPSQLSIGRNTGALSEVERDRPSQSSQLSIRRSTGKSLVMGSSLRARSPDVVDLEMEAADYVPSSPPQKRFREHFLGLSNLSQFTSMIAEPDPVLVKDSDEED